MWKTNGKSEESIESTAKSDGNFSLIFVDHHLLPHMNFNGHCLIKSNVSILKKVINLYISYTLGPQLRNWNTDFTLGNCLFGSVKLTKNAHLDEQKYAGYGIRFYSCSEFLFKDGSYGKSVIIFGADVSSSVHVNNKGKYILILGEGPSQGLDDTTLQTFVGLKTSWRHLQHMSWRRLQHVFITTIFRLSRYLEDVLGDEKFLR